MKPVLYIYTSNYPFSKTSEAFFEPEIGYALDFFGNVTVVPVNGDPYRRETPQGVLVDEILVHRSIWASIRALLGLFTFRVLNREKGERPHSLAHFKDAIKYLFAANLVYYDLKKRVKGAETPVVLYSYWLTYSPIAFAWIKKQYPNKRIIAVSRAHGSDIYSTDVGVYLPKRRLVLNQIDEIFTVSSYGKNYLESRYGGTTPISVSRLGVADNFVEKQKDDSNIYVVSCSNLIPLKRVPLLFCSLNTYAREHPAIQISWTHIGGGPIMEEMRRLSSIHEPNISVFFAGPLNNSEIMELYRTHFFDCYVLLSESEGIPVSIMEALSSGIPVISSNVGGVSEIVNDKTGVLLNKDFDQAEFNSAIDAILSNVSLRETSHDYFMENYESRRNYTDFYKKVLRIV